MKKINNIFFTAQHPSQSVVRCVGMGLLFLFSIAMNLVDAQKTITFPSKDGLTITADFYESKPADPYIILFHQANFSRGEYRETAQRFRKLGYNCLAIDQRSGNEVNFVKNQTAEAARLKSLPTNYLDARQDMEAAIDYVKSVSEKPFVIVGSSYSASLSLVLASKNPNVKAVIVFSPGEYFGEKLDVTSFIENINCPIFVTASRSEMSNVKPMFAKAKSRYLTMYTPTLEGIHGSKALWTETKGSDEYWLALMQFFSQLK